MPTNEQRRAAAKRKLERRLQRHAQQARRRRILAIVAGSVVAVVVVAAALGTLWYRSHRQHATQASAPGSSPTTPASGAPGAMPAAAPSIPSLPPFTPSPSVGANCQYPPSPQPADKPVKPPRSGKIPTDPATVSVSMMTNQGPVGLLLANNESPCTVNSFVSLAEQNFFDGTGCHRLTTAPTLGVLQCGDPSGHGTGGPGYQFADEYPTDQYPPNDPALDQPVRYPRGTLAMANAGPNTNGSQFFLVYRDSQLPPKYTVFGTIQDDGLATLDKIARQGVAGGGEDGPPAVKVTITSVRLD